MSSNGSYQAILFDLDGTLLDTAPDFHSALNRLLLDNGKAPLPAETVRRGVTHGSAGLITLAFGLERADPNFELLRQDLLRYYGDCLTEQTRLFDGMADLLAEFDRLQLPWGIVTNKPFFYTDAILKKLPLPSSPAAVVCPDHVSHNKPHPEPVLLACRQIGVSPELTLYVGDHLRDIQSGREAGARTAAAAYGYIDPAENPRQWGADFVIAHAGELAPIIFDRQAI